MSIFFRSDDRVEESDVRNNSPLAGYAAVHWVGHARYQNVSSYLQRAMEYLFDPDKPYFAAWLQLYDMDTKPGGLGFYSFTPTSKSRATPLYYAALCGFQDLVEHLTVNNPGLVNATGGYFVAPLVAALSAGHFEIAKFLRDNGAHPNVTGHIRRIPLHGSAYHGDFEMVQVLLEYKADVNAGDNNGETPLHLASQSPSNYPNLDSPLPKIARLLLEHGADVNARRKDYLTALHLAAQRGRVEVVRVLLEHGADVGAEAEDGKTAFQLASGKNCDEVKKLLSEHGAG